MVTVRAKASEQLRIANALEIASQRAPVEWVEVDAKKKEGMPKSVQNVLIYLKTSMKT